jgi:hypothetical protein
VASGRGHGTPVLLDEPNRLGIEDPPLEIAARRAGELSRLALLGHDHASGRTLEVREHRRVAALRRDPVSGHADGSGAAFWARAVSHRRTLSQPSWPTSNLRSAPTRIRTWGLLLRRESLYPTELSGPRASLGLEQAIFGSCDTSSWLSCRPRTRWALPSRRERSFGNTPGSRSRDPARAWRREPGRHLGRARASAGALDPCRRPSSWLPAKPTALEWAPGLRGRRRGCAPAACVTSSRRRPLVWRPRNPDRRGSKTGGRALSCRD